MIDKINKYLPFTQWLFHYRKRDLSGDIIAGIIVAVMLVPQSMAYALLAGLPPQVGLYASILPPIMYGLLGTSGVLAVGPAAVDSLLVATAIGAMNPQNTEQYISLALVLALQIGLIQMTMGLLRVGFLVNFLSHPVLSGFTSAAAIIIAASQLKHVLGLQMPRYDYFYQYVIHAVENIGAVNLVAVGLGLGSIAVMLFFKKQLQAILRSTGLSETWILPLTKTGPLVVVVLGTLAVWLLNLEQSASLAIVGEVPAGLPPVGVPLFDLDVWRGLLPFALAISLVGFTESISVAKSLVSKKRGKIDANQELIAIGAANVSASFSGGYPVTGGLSRSVVNFSAGANTGLASIITALLIGITLLFLTPLFYYLPQAVLAAIILVAVTNLFDLKTFRHTLKYDKSDALSLVVTFGAVLFAGIEMGILIGAGTAIGLHLWRTSRPHTAVVGRIGETEHFRNVERHEVQLEDDIIVIRVDESLYFPNAQYLEELLLNTIAERPQVNHLVLMCSAVNYIDTSALQVLESLRVELSDAGVKFYLSEVKGPVMDRLEKIGFVDEIGRENIFLSTHIALETLCQRHHYESEITC